MNLVCLRCLAPDQVVMVLDAAPRFKCEKCTEEYTAAEAKQMLADLHAAWEPAIKWAEALPPKGSC